MRILMRAGKTPLDSFNPVTTLEENILLGNSGNQLFSHAVFKHLSHSKNQIKIGNFDYGQENAAKINEQYDALVLPLANAFRPSFLSKLERLSALIEKLKIPVVVAGIGAQTDANYDLEKLRSINKGVSRFVKAVLERSASIGVRGECTAAYLSKLGFRDVDIIGCPSLFYYGNRFAVRPAKSLNKQSKIAISISTKGSQAAFTEKLRYMGEIFDRNFEIFKEITYVGQENSSLELLLFGRSTTEGIEHREMSPRLANYLFDEGRVRFFTEPVTWFRSLTEFDFVTGSRLHGCIAGLIGGTPAFMFAHDSRTLEIARHFNIPHQVLDEHAIHVRFDEALAHADYHQLERTQAQRLQEYAHFLDKNGLQHIVLDDAAMNAFDARVDAIPRVGEIRPDAVSKRFAWVRENALLQEKRPRKNKKHLSWLGALFQRR
jgi:hypothetical protein